MMSKQEARKNEDYMTDFGDIEDQLLVAELNSSRNQDRIEEIKLEAADAAEEINDSPEIL